MRRSPKQERWQKAGSKSLKNKSYIWVFSRISPWEVNWRFTCSLKTPQQGPFPALCSSNRLLWLSGFNSSRSFGLGDSLDLSQNLAGKIYKRRILARNSKLTIDHACAIFLESPCHKDPKNDAPSPWVCYGVVWYCMVCYGMLWVLTIDDCYLLVATFDNLWQLLTTCGNLWQLLATCGKFCQLNAIFTNL